MTKYPEGQWEAAVNTLGRQIVRRQVDEWDWEVIAFCVGDNCEADACFIADAPETAAERDRLLEELEAARTALRWIKEEIEEQVSIDVIGQLLAALETVTDEDALIAFANDLRRYPNESVLILLTAHFPQLHTAIAAVKGVTG